MKMKSVIFREYDIRGVYDEDFDADFAEVLAQAFVAHVRAKTGEKNPRLTVGHDARLSSPTIADRVVQGFKKSGAHVMRLGLVTSPLSYFSTFAIENCHGGIMITGSHNPPEYNGFKISLGKTTIHGEEIKALEKIILNKSFSAGTGSEETIDILTPYVDRYKKEFGQIKDVPVVVDCGNGAAGAIVRRLYEAVGLKPVILFEKPDGTFPNHHPDPTVEKNLVVLKEEVKRTKSIVGIGFDGDADRIGIVDEQGRFILGDEMICLIAKSILARNPGAKIIGDVKCSDRMYDYIAKYGGKPIMSKTGHSLIKDRVKKENAHFGGELSGHVFFADRNYGYDDAPYAGLRIVEILAQTGKTISELLSDLPPSHFTPEIRIDTTEEKKHLIVEKLIEKFSAPSGSYGVNLLDGIRVSFKDGWGLARASNTQPVLVLRFEANSDSSLQKIRREFEEVVESIL